ncbi:flagellin [Algicella marina]|uniref:Flagellin n=1 Tax=Algicella marina TaxID=2683284 RepID=A0A6P1T411_9RHOB|nr:flagellin [Algicella marina]QHQ36440.1 flagellin [Algicella marina]
MSSILTNNSAMVALQTLNSINKNLAMTQNEISTGKSIATAKDNSAIWAISQVMQSDVDGFDAISDSLGLGESTVAVGRNASERVTELLGDIKSKIVAAQEDNVDRDKLQTDLSSLRDQISGIVSAAQFNGQNLLSNTTTTGEGTIDVLASLDRDSIGNVTSNSISVAKQDLGQTDNTAGTAADQVGSNTAIAVGDSDVVSTFTSTSIVAGQTFAFDLTAGLSGGADVALTGSVSYVAREGDTMAVVVDQMVARLNYEVTNQGYGDSLSFSSTSTAGEISMTNNSENAVTVGTADVTEDTDGTAADGTIGGGLELLGDIDVSTADGAAAALAAIETLTQTAISASAEFGTSEKRIDIQQDFISKLTDSLKSGIGSLVDADMEQASARLQALQVQQQLGIQSLSIANQAPQNILSLFR